MKLALLRGTLFELEEAEVLSGSGQSTAVDVLSISSRCALDARTPQDVLHRCTVARVLHLSAEFI